MIMKQVSADGHGEASGFAKAAVASDVLSLLDTADAGATKPEDIAVMPHARRCFPVWHPLYHSPLNYALGERGV